MGMAAFSKLPGLVVLKGRRNPAWRYGPEQPVDGGGAHSFHRFLTSRLQEQFAVPLRGTRQFRQKGFQRLAAHPVAGLPDRLQSRYRLLSVLLGPARFLAGASGRSGPQCPNQGFTMMPGDLDRLIKILLFSLRFAL